MILHPTVENIRKQYEAGENMFYQWEIGSLIFEIDRLAALADKAEIYKKALEQIANAPAGSYGEDCMGNTVYYEGANKSEIARIALAK